MQCRSSMMLGDRWQLQDSEASHGNHSLTWVWACQKHVPVIIAWLGKLVADGEIIEKRKFCAWPCSVPAGFRLGSGWVPACSGCYFSAQSRETGTFRESPELRNSCVNNKEIIMGGIPELR